MAKLTSKQRGNLSKSTFAIPSERKYPIPDRSHGQNALARSANKSPKVKAEVRAAVARKYPGLVNRPEGKR